MAQRRSLFVRQLCLALLLAFSLGAIASARADAPTVTAVLTSSETGVDQPVQLQIKITGDANAQPPNDINVDGLEIHYTGQSQLVEGRNFKFTYSFVYNYTILPEKAGSFTIPPQKIRTNSGVLTTPELTLNVAPNDNAGTTNTGRRSRQNGGIDPRKIVFAELVIPKTSAYVGEIIPAEIRLGFNAHVRMQLSEEPSIGGEGFTVQPLRKPEQTTQTMEGQTFNVLTYKTAIAAAHTGRLEIGPAQAKVVAELPRRSNRGNRSPLDLFGMNDPFSDPFFNDPFGSMMMEQREVPFKSQPATLEIKPLPPNAPASFGGAVGNFSLTSEVKPKNAQVGDPLTLTATISGRGNFDRVNAPELSDAHGWHTYPPNAHFKEDDDIGLSGTKTFEMVLTPNEKKNAVPPLVFTYFDPIKENYVTLKSDRLPVLVEGGAIAAPTSAVASASAAPRAVVRPTAQPQAEDILYQLTDQPRWVSTFAPVFHQPVFWVAQALPLLGLVGFFGFKTRQRRLTNRENLRLAAWQHESAELQKKLRRGDEPVDQYLADALRLLQLKTALARRIEPNSVDAETAVSAFDLASEKQERVRELFRRTDELRYSGGENGEDAVTDATRREVSELLESLI